MNTSLPNRPSVWSPVFAAAISLACISTSFGQTPTYPPTPTASLAQSPTSEQLLNQSADSLDQAASFQAEFRHRVQLHGRDLMGKGVYRQAIHRQQKKYRLELTLRVGEQSASIEQASNGRFLWIRRNLPGHRSLTRLDLREVRDAAAELFLADSQRFVPADLADGTGGGAEGTARGAFGSATEPILPGVGPELMGLDGLASTLRGFRRRFEFEQPRTATLAGQPVWVLQGRWKRDALRRIAPRFDPQQSNLSRLPEHIPTHVIVLLSQSEQWPLFPHRIEYRRAHTTWNAPLTETDPVLTMEFSNVLRRAPFDARQFEFPADEQLERDITSEYIERLRAMYEE